MWRGWWFRSPAQVYDPQVGGVALIAGETDGMGIDFTYHTDRSRQMAVTTSSAAVLSDPFSTLTYTSPSIKLCRQSDGVWRYSNHNFLVRSQEFDSASWTKLNATVSANSTTAPDGTSTADTLVEDSNNAQHRASQATGNNGFPGRLSVYAKAKERSWICVSTDDGDSYFDLTNGVMGGTNQVGGTITSAGNGWYLCSVVGASNNVKTTMYICMATGNGANSYAGDGASGVYLWGAQSKRTPVNDAQGFTLATGYIATVAAARYDLPYEWDASGNPQGILIEEQRTNICLRSQEFGTTWAVSGGVITVSANSTTAPDGTTTADTLTPSTGNFGHSIAQSVTLSTSTAYTYSCFFKRNGYDYVYIFAEGTGAGQYQVFNLNTGALGTTTNGTLTAAISNAGNGWYRCSISITTGGSVGSNFITIGVQDADNVSAYAGDGTSGIFAWGGQLEAGSFITSPIHTIGATVTRAADDFDLSTSLFPFSTTNGTVIVSTTSRGLVSDAYVWQLRGDDNNRAALQFASANPNMIDVENSNIDVNADLGTVVAGVNTKIGIAMSDNDWAGVQDGGTVVTDATSNMPTGASFLNLGNNNGSSFYTGHIRQLTYLARRATNGELQTRTT